jgi:XTP/dITP diphosphohydrolase
MNFIVSTANQKKLAELKPIFAALGIELIALKELGFDADIEETGTTFEENALIKARAAAAFGGMPALADDSGLCVDYLGGAPGIYSALWRRRGKNRYRAL